MSHWAILLAAQEKACVCHGRAAAAWEQILILNRIDVAQYCSSLRALFQSGGGKGLKPFVSWRAQFGQNCFDTTGLGVVWVYSFPEATSRHELRLGRIGGGQGCCME